MVLIPLVEQWVQRGIVIGAPSVITDDMHFSQFFMSPKKWQSSPHSSLFLPEYFLNKQGKVGANPSSFISILRGSTEFESPHLGSSHWIFVK